LESVLNMYGACKGRAKMIKMRRTSAPSFIVLELSETRQRGRWTDAVLEIIRKPLIVMASESYRMRTLKMLLFVRE
jgi:hypothetical protein